MHDLSVIVLLAGARADAERAWLDEFDVEYVADVYAELTDALVRAVRRVL